MRPIDDAKAKARKLRQELLKKNIDVTHADALEIYSKMSGAACWNQLRAELDQAKGGSVSDTNTRPWQPDWLSAARPFYERHLSISDRQVPARHRNDYWQRLFDEANALYARGEPPLSDKVSDLAKRWIAHSWNTSGSNLDYKTKSAAAYAEALKDPAVASKLPMSAAVLDFIAPALKAAMSERLAQINDATR